MLRSRKSFPDLDQGPESVRPRSLLGIALELISKVEAPGPFPADARVGKFFRARRFLGSRDRRFLGDALYAWLRGVHRARPRWRAWAELRALTVPTAALPRKPSSDAGGDPDSTAKFDPTTCGETTLDLLALAEDERFPWSFTELSAAVAELAEEGLGDWHTLVAHALEPGFVGADCWPADPVERYSAEISLPIWLGRRVLEQYGEEAGKTHAAALLQPAPLDVRVNLRRAERERVRKMLTRETKLEVEPTAYSSLGLRLSGRKNLTATTPSKKSWIEVQDEGSQLAVLCSDVAPGMRVIDACAGGGGKTLALADILFRDVGLESPRREEPDGHLCACEIDRRKIGELLRRGKEARVAEFLETAVVAEEGDLAPLLTAAHLVLVDAPCTGVGTLRRNPELALRYSEEDPARFHATQLAILERFSSLVRKRGRLVYVTCSFLREECEGVVEAFERAHPEFEPSPSFYASSRLPPHVIDGHRIRLSPESTQTDAFFIASWKRREESGA